MTRILLLVILAGLAYLLAVKWAFRVTGEPDPYAEPWFA